RSAGARRARPGGRLARSSAPSTASVSALTAMTEVTSCIMGRAVGRRAAERVSGAFYEEVAGGAGFWKGKCQELADKTQTNPKRERGQSKPRLRFGLVFPPA